MRSTIASVSVTWPTVVPVPDGACVASAGPRSLGQVVAFADRRRGCVVGHRGVACAIYVQVEDVRPCVVSDGVEVEPGADDLIGVDVGGEDAGLVIQRAGEYVAQRADDHASAAAHHGAGVGWQHGV